MNIMSHYMKMVVNIVIHILHQAVNEGSELFTVA